MEEIDPVSKTLGELLAEVRNLSENFKEFKESSDKSTNALWENSRRIEEVLTSHRVKMAGISALVSVVVAGAITFLLKKIEVG